MDDICAAKHGGNQESKAAFGKGKDAQRQRVFDAILDAGEDGMTCDELAVLWNVGCNTISGRFADLKRNGLIEERGKRRTRTNCFARVCVTAV